jgi:hypothetical protein
LTLGSSYLAKKPRTHALVAHFREPLAQSNLLLWQYLTTMHPNTNLSHFTWPRLLPKINFCLPTWTDLFQTHRLSLQVPLNAISSLWPTNVTLVPLKTFMFR